MLDVLALAAVDIEEVTRPKSSGKMVDSHVASNLREPRPDYERMRLLTSVPVRSAKVEHGRREEERSRSSR